MSERGVPKLELASAELQPDCSLRCSCVHVRDIIAGPTSCTSSTMHEKALCIDKQEATLCARKETSSESNSCRYCGDGFWSPKSINLNTAKLFYKYSDEVWSGKNFRRYLACTFNACRPSAEFST